jgi:hypothetical protein
MAVVEWRAWPGLLLPVGAMAHCVFLGVFLGGCTFLFLSLLFYEIRGSGVNEQLLLLMMLSVENRQGLYHSLGP